MNYFKDYTIDNDTSCLIECTVVSGFENLAKEECFQKLGVRAACSRGRIVFEILTDHVSKVLKLKSVDNVYVVIHLVPTFNFGPDKAACLAELNSIIEKCNWEKGLNVWQKLMNYTEISLEEIVGGRKQQLEPGSSISDIANVSEANADNESIATGPQTPDLLRDVGDFAKREADVETSGACKPESNQQLNTLLAENLHIVADPSQDVADSAEKTVQSLSDETDQLVDRSTDQVTSQPEIQAGQKEELEPKLPHQKFKFRVTCHRSGGEHSFGSPEAAVHFGSAVQTHFQWKPDMTQFDLEVMLNIVAKQVHVSLSLTRQSLHKRDITCFGKTTLRSTIAYNMLQLARIKDGDVVCDPMCGTGVIPVEGAVSWSKAAYLCGDLDPFGPEKTRQNMVNYNEALASSGDKTADPLCLDIFRWDATCLPLKTSSVDVFVTDLPFGKRSGKKFDNRKLYPEVLFEMARTAHLARGRAVVLTHDRRSIIKALQKVARYWRTVQMLTINIGGLAASVYYLERRANAEFNSTSSY